MKVGEEWCSFIFFSIHKIWKFTRIKLKLKSNSTSFTLNDLFPSMSIKKVSLGEWSGAVGSGHPNFAVLCFYIPEILQASGVHSAVENDTAK